MQGFEQWLSVHSPSSLFEDVSPLAIINNQVAVVVDDHRARSCHTGVLARERGQDDKGGRRERG